MTAPCLARLARRSILAFALPGLGLAHAGTISGQYVIGGKTVEVHEVAAFRVRDQFNPRALETYVMLTARPVDRAKIGAALDPYAVAINDPAVRDADYLAFSVRAGGETSVNASVGGVQYLDSSGSIMGMPGSLVATCRENTATRIAYSVKTAKPVKAMTDRPGRWTSLSNPTCSPARRASRWRATARLGQGLSGPARGGRRQRSGEDPGVPAAAGGQELSGGLAHPGREPRRREGDPERPAAEEPQDHRRRVDGRRPRGARGRRGAVRKQPHALPRRDAADRRALALRRRERGGMFPDEPKSPSSPSSRGACGTCPRGETR